MSQDPIYTFSCPRGSWVGLTRNPDLPIELVTLFSASGDWRQALSILRNLPGRLIVLVESEQILLEQVTYSLAEGVQATLEPVAGYNESEIAMLCWVCKEELSADSVYLLQKEIAKRRLPSAGYPVVYVLIKLQGK